MSKTTHQTTECHIPADFKHSAIPLSVSQIFGGGGVKQNNKHSETLKITYKTELSQLNYPTKVGWDSAVGIATHYNRTVQGLNPGGG